jgi:general L-amino acid transport system substrate-binding protein
MMSRKFFTIFVLCAVFAVTLAVSSTAIAGDGSTLASVKKRGFVKCAINDHKIGFGFLLKDGSLTGFDWDYCRAVAAATLGDAKAAEGRPTSSSDRFPVLQSGEVDMLVRNTTWNITRDTVLGFDFAPTTFYDGQGIMVRVDSGVTKLKELDGASVCISAGTSNEKNLANTFRSLGLKYQSIIFNKTSAASEAYKNGRCDAYTSDRSSLVSRRTTYGKPEAHVILPVVMSKEPLAPAVRHGDDNWFDIVKWTVNCTIAAEEFGINQENVEDMLSSDDPTILELLGVEGDLGRALGVKNDFCYQVVKQVGNYKDIYDKHLGPGTRVNLERGLNALWTEGGLMYSPPFH